jgi:hypothetical protein
VVVSVTSKVRGGEHRALARGRSLGCSDVTSPKAVFGALRVAEPTASVLSSPAGSPDSGRNTVSLLSRDRRMSRHYGRFSMGYEEAKADVKKTMREADNKAKETWRRADGEESLSDKVANTGDDIRTGLGNAGDDIRVEAEKIHEDADKDV